jgi:DnaK suppressor protein
MNTDASRFDQAFLRHQRQRLMEIRAQLRAATLNTQSHGESGEYEDDAQKLAMLEVEGTLVAHDLRRLAQVERALAKIEDGTYGLSDSSGQPIPKERLEAMPEATDTVNH